MTKIADSDDTTTKARARWMSVLARASAADLQAALDGMPPLPAYTFLRRPEIGLAMVRGRSGGTGNPFNFGEMTVTRCALRLADGVVGHSYCAGRDLRKAELAAVLDALLQTERGEAIASEIIEPLARQQQTARDLKSRKAAATKVEFFTMVRGDDPL